MRPTHEGMGSGMRSQLLDQFFLIGVSAAFGAICLALFFWQKQMLVLMLAPQFHPWVLASGFLLTGLAAVRAVMLWKSSARDRAHHGVHECGHDHGDHCAHDHDHGWAPWRYAVLLMPITLFLLGLPNKGPQVRAAEVHVDMADESIGYAGLIGSGPDARQQLVLAAALSTGEATAEPAIALDFKTLESASADRRDREHWKGKRVRVSGQCAPFADRTFALVRLRMKCCGADLVPVIVPVQCKESLRSTTKALANEWIVVTGRIDFQRLGSGYQTILRLPNARSISPTVPDPRPWIY
jgi:hypothetical protein